MTTATPTTDEAQTTDDHGTDHAAGGERPRYDDINTPVIFLVGFISTIATFLTIAFVQGLYYQWHDYQVRIVETENTPVLKIVEDQKQNLTGQVADTVSIDESMKQVIAQYGTSE